MSEGVGDQMEIINERDDADYDEIIMKIENEPRDISSLNYDLSVMTISNVRPIIDNFSCRICMATVRNPVVVKHCLHFFCKECLEMSMRQL